MEKSHRGEYLQTNFGERFRIEAKATPDNISYRARKKQSKFS